MAFTHSILHPLHPLLRNFFPRVSSHLQEGLLESLERVCLAHSKIEVGDFGLMCFDFVNMLFFDYRLLLTSRCMLIEVFMTVVMNRSQQHGRRGQRIGTRPR